MEFYQGNFGFKNILISKVKGKTINEMLSNSFTPLGLNI